MGPNLVERYITTLSYPQRQKGYGQKMVLGLFSILGKNAPKSTLMPPKITIMASTTDIRSRQLTTPSFGQIGDRPQTLPPDLGEPLKKPLLRG